MNSVGVVMGGVTMNSVGVVMGGVTMNSVGVVMGGVTTNNFTYCVYVTVYRKTGHNAAYVNIEKRSIDFLKMYCFKPTEGNG